MAGMEQLEVHSKSYLVRWIQVPGGNTISWSLQPLKKSINFGIFKHPGLANGATPNLSSLTEHQAATTPDADTDTQRKVSTASNLNIQGDKPPSVVSKLERLGIKSVEWTGKCESDHVSMGRYDVPVGEGGYYGLVFDNTYSKSLSKTVTFVLMTYPTSSPPKSGHHLHFSHAMNSSTSLGSSSKQPSPRLLPVSDSNESLPQDVDPNVLSDTRPRSNQGAESKTQKGATFYTGVLSKKRRKRNQGYARRFFSLDFTSATLSYYKNRNSSALRGSIPLSLAVIAVDEKLRQISVDSGAEIWILRAHSQRDFSDWRKSLEWAAKSSSTPISPLASKNEPWAAPKPGPVEENDWEQIESLVGQVAGVTDAVRRLARDTDPRAASEPQGLGIRDAHGQGSGTPSPTEFDSGDYFQGVDMPSRPSFWRRKSSSHSQSPSGMFGKRSSSAQRKYASNSLAPPSSSPIPIQVSKRNQSAGYRPTQEGAQIHNNCEALLRDLDKVVAQFSSLIAESRARRAPQRPVPHPRNSLDSTISQEFYDAEDGLKNTTSQVLTIQPDSDEEESVYHDDVSVADSASSSDVDPDTSYAQLSAQGQPSAFPPPPKSLTPLPLAPVPRRSTIPPASGPPPSLISFLRKNVGKDLSTIAMPVTANEPLSLLQRQAEALEYSHLLDAAAASPAGSAERLLHLAAFALSPLAATRAPARAVRKPFNPMLGETFELVREDGSFRFLAEKVSHRPVRLACQADAARWSLTAAPAPSQKFWGKSAELVTDGRVRVALFAEGGKGDAARYSWAPASCFLRNVLAGEKHVEPVGTLTVVDEDTGAKAVATFKASGMFGGRSEEVAVAAYGADGALLPLGLRGRWTSALGFVREGREVGEAVWTARPLVDGAASRFGLTTFAAQLNEVTAVEEGALPPTDSRLRPDQRAYEEGRVEEAERVKVALEEGQRRRRREMEAEGGVWAPRWFRKVDGAGEGEEAWVMKGEGEGEGGGYWDVRAAVVGFKGGRWDGVREVFELG